MTSEHWRPIRRALLSVSDKTGLIDFAKFLAAQGVELLSTGGTAKAIRDAGVPVKDVAEYTNFPEMMEGRVKTLHPRVHGGILAKRGQPDHEEAMGEHGIDPIDLVVVNLYPFGQTVAAGKGYDDCVEQIDIGGPAMVRSAAKNHADVTIIVDPADYASVRSAMETNASQLNYALRQQLAAKAYAHTASYDSAIAAWFAGQLGLEPFPESLTLTLTRQQTLRYGENPHQQAAWYRFSGAAEGLASIRQLQGKELSYNNLNDTDAAWQLVQEFSGQLAVAIIKHANPCGVAIGKTQEEAFKKALACDPQSAFGGIIALNTKLEAATVEALGSLFLEVIIAPGVSPEAAQLLEKKKNLRLLVAEGPAARSRQQVRAISGGLLVQDEDREGMPAATSLKTVTKRTPTAAELTDLQLAFVIAKHVKSNAIVLVKDGATIGIGAGQMSRVDSVRIATIKAKEAGLDITGASLASDAFFPFDDNIHLAAQHGIAALIQPGGSIRDEDVVKAADEHGMAMVLTGIRHFRH